MTLDQAIEAEAQAQAICMQTQDFKRAYEAFVAKQKPRGFRATKHKGHNGHQGKRVGFTFVSFVSSVLIQRR